MDKWWIIEGVKHPTYIGLKEPRKTISSLLYIVYALVILSLFILESMDVLPIGTTLSFVTSSVLLDVIFKVVSKKKLTRIDAMYIRGLLKTLDGKIIRWSIPSHTIPVVGVLDNGVNLLLFYDNARGLVILLFKPLIYYRVLYGKPQVKYKWKIIVKDSEFRKGLLQLTYPHTDIRSINYIAIVKSIYLPAGIENNKLLNIINNFEKYTEDIPVTGVLK